MSAQIRRLGVLLSHPVQYYAPWFRHLAGKLELTVFYAHRQDARGQADAGFGVEFEWDTPLLEGYRYRWLTNVGRHPSVDSFTGCDTPEIYDILRSEPFDAFLVFGWNRKSAIQTIRACRRSKVPVLMRGDSQLRTSRSRARSIVKYLPYRWFLPRFAGHLYVGQRNKAYLRRYGVPEERLHFAPHFVDNAFFAESAQKAKASGKPSQIRAKLAIPGNSFVVLFAGKMIPRKRPADFIRACLKVFDQPDGSDIHAVLVGDGPLRPSLEDMARRCSERIHFAGFWNQTRLPGLYKACDALALTSDGTETWGLVVNEAMACGIPAVVTDAAGCSPDLIDEGGTGYVYPLGDVEALASRILALKSVLEQRPESVRRALAEKVARYSMEKATEGLESALEAVDKEK